MFRIWAREFKDNRVVSDMTIADDSNDTRTHKVFRAIEKICLEFDLSSPIWLDKTVKDFKKHAKTRFYKDNFIDETDFDFLEIEVIEED